MPVPPIVIAEQSGGTFSTNSSNALNIQFSPPELFFAWIMSYPFPADFQSTVKFPNYADSDEYSAFTDWKLNVAMNHFYYYFFSETASVPFCEVEGDFNYEGSLGVLADGFYTKTLNFQFVNLNLLSEGQYYAKAVTTISAINPTTGLRETISEKTLNIELSPRPFNLVTPLQVAYEGKSYDLSNN
ncbi:MAG: hypothetical protein ACK4ON_13240, partial [Bacteroidia bacterium]